MTPAAPKPPRKTPAPRTPAPAPPGKKAPGHNGLPTWLTACVVLVLLGLLAYNIIVVGPEGLPTSYILGGLLGAYAGVDQLLKRRDGGGGGDDG